MFDGSFATYEKIKRQGTVTIFPITSDNKIIIAKEFQPNLPQFIGCLGGRVEEGEDPLLAAQRELLEESGFEAYNWQLWQAFQFFEKIEWPMYIFIAKNLAKIQEPHLDAGEKIELVEYSFDNFIKLTAQGNYRDFEISLLIYRLMQNNNEMLKLKQLLSN